MFLTVMRMGLLLAALCLIGLLAPVRSPALTRRTVRRLLERGGVTTIKIGQYLAIRRDLFSAEMCAELARLFDAVPPMAPATVRRIIERELDGPVDRFFASIDWTPIGAASIAQVHRAHTRSGAMVAVKVQRPGLEARLAADFGLLHQLARIGDGLALFGGVKVAELVAEISTFTRREVDFRAEGRTAERIAADPGRGVHVPAIIWPLCTRRLLVMEFIEAVPLARAVALAEAGDDRAFAAIAPGIATATIVAALARAFLRQLFVTGLFHGDPHPANVLIRRDGGIALIDFGIFGELGPADRALLTGYVEHLALGRFDAAFDCYRHLVHFGPRTDPTAFRHDAVAVLAAWHAAATDPSTPVELQLTARYQGIMFAVMREHGVRMGTQHLLFWRALGMLDSTAHRLPGDFNLLAAIRHYFAARRPALTTRAVRAGADAIVHARWLLPDAIDAVATIGREPIRTDDAISSADRREDARIVRTISLILVSLALALHAAALAPLTMLWPVAATLAVIALAIGAAGSRRAA
ncbi:MULTISPECIES: AarF/ABC1/UbiB kinase family protein [unclassified Sphingomonas]|uniref:ABC1 kinase family protein n=1 Tax=unclassified Sphingomonas TaxID=196159 RepID=UPI002269CD2C|nr:MULTISPECIES: AarF/ABC1/UbiB kinase family protein [unclassified Sphingomonas]